MASPGNQLKASTVMAVIREIEAGRVTLLADDWTYSGNVVQRFSNGWTFVVFSDCGEFDYFDRIIAPDGLCMDFDQIWDRGHAEDATEDEKALCEYDPDATDMLEKWGAGWS